MAREAISQPSGLIGNGDKSWPRRGCENEMEKCTEDTERTPNIYPPRTTFGSREQWRYDIQTTGNLFLILMFCS